MRNGFDYSSIMLPDGWHLEPQDVADQPGEAPFLAVNPEGIAYSLVSSDGWWVQAWCKTDGYTPGIVSLPIDPMSSEFHDGCEG